MNQLSANLLPATSMTTKVQTMNWTKLRSSLLVLALAAAPVWALAQTSDRPPGQISYQGYLIDANGIPLATNTPKNFNVTFKLYNDSTATASTNTLWAEQQVVTVDRGYFTVLLGAGSAVSGVFNTNDLSGLFYMNNASSRYLGITVQGLANPDLEIAPRLRLTTSPYALLAANATALTGPSAAANGLVVKNGLVVDGANQNSGPLLTNTALTFGSGGTEGIASQRSATPAGLQNDLALFTAGQPRVTVLNNGYVGIGATNPAAPLTVAGNFGANNGLGLQINGANGGGSMLNLLESGNWGWAVGLLPLQSRLSFFDNRYPGSPGTEVMCLARGGLLGIGTTTPSFPLDVNGIGQFQYGTQIGAVGSGFYGDGTIVGVRAFNSASSDILFQTYRGNATLMTIKNGGNVGIGQSAPGFPLNFSSALGDKISLWGNSGGHYGFGVQGSLLQIHTDTSAADVAFGYGTSSSFTERMRVTGTGRVGIGTTTPRAPLDVAVSLTGYAGSFMRLGYTGTPSLALTTGYVTTDNPSIIATGDILSGAMIIASDARLKKVGGRSDGQADLNKLMGVEVTDYTMIDAVTQGDRPYKKVVAQQVEGVYPQAVSRTTGVVPDIYAKAEASGGLITLAAPVKTALKAGDKVRLVNERGSELHEVTEVSSTGFRVKDPIEGPVFVYGREVSDFRSVDYDAISMLNVSATQELARQLTAEKTEVAKLRAENEGLAAKLNAIEARFARLEKAQADANGDKEMVSLKRK